MLFALHMTHFFLLKLSSVFHIICLLSYTTKAFLLLTVWRSAISWSRKNASKMWSAWRYRVLRWSNIYEHQRISMY